MNKFNLKIKNIALKDMEKIADFIAKDSPKAAHSLLSDFYCVFETICEFPKIGHIRKDLTNLDVRFFRAKQNYIIVYNVEHETVCILRVLSNYREISLML